MCNDGTKRFWRHDWDQWSVVEKADITRHSDNTHTGWILLQHRTCNRCGLTLTRTDKKGI